MTRRQFLVSVMLVAPAVAALTVTSMQPRTMVRGRLYRVSDRGQTYNAPGIGVRLTHPHYGPSPTQYTDSYGMYYLPNVPPSRNEQDVYVLEILLSKDHVLRYTIRALAQPFTDIAPIRVP